MKQNQAENIVETRKFLKDKLLNDTATFLGFEKERELIKSLFLKTNQEQFGENALLIGGPKCGKTTLINSVLYSLLSEKEFCENTHVICLDGFYHTDDRLALKTATEQLKLEKLVEGKVFNSFAENFSFLLSCLYSGDDSSKRLIFIIEEFDLFCAHHNQSLLYNLFDVAQSARLPICVLGVTSRLDVIELLEKRVKSRFSHRQIFLLPTSDKFSEYLALCESILSLPESDGSKKIPEVPKQILQRREFMFLRRNFKPQKYSFDKSWKSSWNASVKKFMSLKQVQRSLRSFYEFDTTICALKNLLFQIVCELNENSINLNPDSLELLVEKLLTYDDKSFLIEGLSVLEICLLISMKHHCDIYDRDPFNFEIVFSRFSKFSNKSSTMSHIDREVALKAFEHLKCLEFIAPIGHEGKVQKEYQLYKLLLRSDQVVSGIKASKNLPTEVDQWAASSLI